MFGRSVVSSVLLVLIVFLSNQPWSSQQADEPFYCDSHAKIKEIRELPLKRIFYSYMTDSIYITLPDKVIYFKAPKITRRRNPHGHYNLITGQAFFKSNVEQDLPDRKVLGHFYKIANQNPTSGQMGSQETYELYLDGRGTTNESRTLMMDKLRKLKFEPVPGERESADVPFSVLPKAFKPPESYKDCWVNIIYYETAQLFLDTVMCNQTVTPFKRYINYFTSFDTSQPVNISSFTIDTSNRILVQERIFNYNKYINGDPESEVNSFTIGTRQRDKFDFLEFMSCQTAINNEREIKGFFYSGGKFYMFLNRHYFVVDKDFVETGKTSSPLKARNLQFADLATTRMEMLRTSWVKTVGDTAYLVPYRRSISEIKVGSDGLIGPLANTGAGKQAYLDSCLYSTLVVQNQLYCFFGKSYYAVIDGRDADAINEKTEYLDTRNIFQGGEQNLWQANERLFWISNYEPGKVIFMTNKNVWKLDYKHFKVGAKKSLSYDISSPNNYPSTKTEMMKNLVDFAIVPAAEADPSTLPPTEPDRTLKDETDDYPTRPTRPSRTDPSETSSADEAVTSREKRDPTKHKWLVYVIIVVATVILILLVALAFVYRKRQEGLTATRQSSLEGGKVKTPSKEQVKTPSTEKVKSTSDLSKTKSPSKRSIKSTSQDKVKGGPKAASKTGSKTAAKTASKTGSKTGSKTSLKSQKSVSQVKTKSKTSLKGEKSVTQLKGEKSITQLKPKSKTNLKTPSKK